jgi:surface antigen Omp85-like protein
MTAKPLVRRVLFLLFIGASYLSICPPCSGQDQPQDGDTSDSPKTAGQTESSKTDPTKPSAEKKEKKSSQSSIFGAPIPVSTPAVGSGVVPVVGYIFPLSKKDKISPPSVIGFAGFITSNGTRGFAAGGQFFMKENTYRFTAAVAHGNINYDIYGSGELEGHKLPLKQSGTLFFGEFSRQIGWKFFLGPQFISGSSVITLRPDEGSDVPIPPDIGFDTNLRSIGIRLTRDTSPNRFYPEAGTYLKFTSDFFSQGLGSKYSFQSYKITFNKYWSLNQNQVLAYNAYLCGTGGAPPFYGNCIYGTSNELRGYTPGRYLTRYMVATQLEYRLVLPKRFGMVAFGGIGEVYPGEDQVYGSQHFLPSGGAGLRFTLDKKHHLNLRADFAQGVDGHVFSLGIGEAF